MATPFDVSDSRSTGNPPGGRGTASQKDKPGKPKLVKIPLQIPVPLELSLRFTLIHLEIAGESNCTMQSFLTELIRKELASLAKTKKVDFSLMQNASLQAGRDAPSSQARPDGAA